MQFSPSEESSFLFVWFPRTTALAAVGVDVHSGCTGVNFARLYEAEGMDEVLGDLHGHFWRRTNNKKLAESHTKEYGDVLRALSLQTNSFVLNNADYIVLLYGGEPALKLRNNNEKMENMSIVVDLDMSKRRARRDIMGALLMSLLVLIGIWRVFFVSH